MDEVLALLSRGDEEDIDDPHEVLMEGSDEDFSDLEEIDDGNTPI